jgi:Na+/H+-dicarboxylate symporter/ABC-type amino acid transport substrate-binding protein
VSLSSAIFLGLGLGALTGVFFGESVRWLGIVGDAFVRLLQMMVLPYVLLSLITSLGRLERSQAATLAGRAGLVYGATTLMALGVVMLFALTFPDWEAATFFSTTLIAEPGQFDLVHLFIPTNPFRALSDSVVPGVVVFSIAIGLALMAMPGKEKVLEPLGLMSDTVGKVTNWVIRLAPVGVFAIVANAAGTLSVDDLGRLQIYGFTYIALSLVMAFWVLPALVAVLTPISWRQVLGPTRDALVTAFATGNLFVVLPILTARSKEILAGAYPDEADVDDSVEVIVPTLFSFPSAGKILTLSWIPFAGWFVGSEMSLGEYPGFAVVGTATFLGSVNTAVPYLLDLYRIPADTFELFIAISNLVNSRFGTLLSATHLIVLALLGSLAAHGLLRVRVAALMRYAVVSLVLVVGTVLGLRVAYETLIPHEYGGYTRFVEMDSHFEAREVGGGRAAVVLPEPVAPDPPPEGRTRLEWVLDRVQLRVCYVTEALPFAFQNADGRLVGYDIDVARRLAGDLGVAVAVVGNEHIDAVTEMLASGVCDVAFSGFAATVSRMTGLGLTRPYLHQTLAFVLPDHARDTFSSVDTIRERSGVRIGVPDVDFFVDRVAEILPEAELVRVHSMRDYVRGKTEPVDAMLYSAEAGSAWTLIYPSFSVAIPHPNVVKVPTVAFVAKSDESLRLLLDQWIDLATDVGLFDELYEHWILGRHANRVEPRWSIARDVLGWGDE